MAEVDTSTYPKPNTSSPLDMAGQIVGIRNALLTGQQQQQALQSGQLDINQKQYNQLLQHREAMVDFFGSLGSLPAAGVPIGPDPNDPTGKKPILSKGLMDDGAVFSYVDRGVKAGLFSWDQAYPELHNILSAKTDAERRVIVNELRTSALNSLAQVQTLTPPATLQDTGSGITGVVNPGGGATPSSQFTIGKGLPVGTMVWDPSQNKYVPSGTSGVPTQGNILPQPGTQTGGQAAAPPPTATGGPQASAGTGFGGFGQPAAPSAAPGQPEAIAGYRKSAGEAAAQLVNTDFPTQRGLLQNVAAETQAIPGFAFGPASGLVHEGLKWFQQLGGGKKEELGSEQAAALDAFVKNTGQLATALLPTIGNSSDRSQIAAMSQNPGLFLSKHGAERIEALLQGSLDAAQYKVNEFQKSGTSPGDYFDWNTNFNKKFDTRVFQWPYMSKAQRDETAAEMGGYNSKRFEKFRSYYNEVRDRGGITLPGQ